MSHGHHPHGQPYPTPRRGMSTGAKFGIGCLGCFGLSVIGSFALLLVGALASTPDSEGDTNVANVPDAADAADGDNEAGERQEGAEEHAALGDAVEHGDWEIIVHAIEYNVPAEQLDEFFAEEPSGQWVAVDMTVKNTGSGPQTFSGHDQVLMDEGGSMYRYEMLASTLIGFDTNPGMEEAGVLAYDVPADFEADHMLVNGESGFADGVRVELE